MNTLLDTLAMIAIWLLCGSVLAGCGFLVRNATLRWFSAEPGGGLAAADMWIGLAATLGYLELWNLFFRIAWFACLPPLALGALGLLAGRRVLGGGRPPALRSAVILGLVFLVVLWIANQSLAAPGDYDLGLYHMNVIGWAENYAAIPGLGDLQSRLGASDAHLLFVALLDHGPWAGAGPHLADGLLVAMLLVDIGLRFLRRGERSSTETFTARMALLLVPATIIVVGIRPTHRISSPNLDLSTYVIVAIGLLYLAESVELGFRPTAVLASTASLAAAATTRPLYWLATVFAIGLTYLGVRRSAGGRAVRVVGLVLLLPGVLMVASTVRQSILSGYPFFPLTTVALPVSWRIPASVVISQSHWDYAWARESGVLPSIVLSSWHWLHYWLPGTERDLDVAGPLALVAALVPSFLSRAGDAPARRRRTFPMLAVLVPSLATLIAWFFLAPDPRFAFGPLWVAPIALTAWALPALRGRLSLVLVIVLAVIAGDALARVSVGHPGQFLPIALELWAGLALAARLVIRRGSTAVIAYAAVLSVALAGIGAVKHRGAFVTVSAGHGGPLGTPPQTVPEVAPVVTTSGLRVWLPQGTDQCWKVLLCVPQLTSPTLRLRGTSVRDGFRMQA